VVGASVLSWLRRRDENYLVIRRAARVTLIACLLFYGCRYGLGDVTLATYALFGTIALGVLSRVPGPPRARARTLLLALPVVWLLVTAGTLLAGKTWFAVAGMLVLGFAVSFAGVGGPRLVGLANGLQLFYILPCFPPQATDTLPGRLVGASLGVVMLAVSEVALWPDPAPPHYPRLLAAAVDRLAALLDGLADAFGGTPDLRRLAAIRDDLDIRAEAVRPSRLPATARPASASRRDHALRHAGAALRFATLQTHRLLWPVEAGVTDPATATLLRAVAATAGAAGRTVAGGTPPVDLGAVEHAAAAFDAGRALRHASPGRDGARLVRLRADAVALTVAEGVRNLAGAARVAAGRPAPRDDRPGEGAPSFWYAHLSTARLWWSQFAVHLTPRSVYFQQALRVAAALAVARLVAGEFGLAHGFWVLLATLTLMRTSAADTRTTLGPALAGALAGAVAAAALSLIGNPVVYQAALPASMVIGFTLGPLLGVAWAQGLFTVVVTLVFAQLTAPSWQLAEVRFVNVLIGGAVGAVIGLLAWPSGGAGELRRTVAACFDSCTGAVERTVAVLRGTGEPQDGAWDARRALTLAEASYAQYLSERSDPRMAHVDWQATLIAALEMIRGGDALLRRYPPGSLTVCAVAGGRLADFAGRLRTAFLALGEELRAGRVDSSVRPPEPPDDVLDRLAASGVDEVVGPRAQHLIDVEVWLAGLTGDLGRIRSPGGRSA
jgi:uncharacterized membrane protein YccC